MLVTQETNSIDYDSNHTCSSFPLQNRGQEYLLHHRRISFPYSHHVASGIRNSKIDNIVLNA